MKNKAGIIKIFKLWSFPNPLGNQNGSIMMITLMILAIITMIGLMSSDMAVTENIIIRNQAIYKQNVNMVDAALMEGLQMVMQWAHSDSAIKITNPPTLVWVNDKDSTFAATTTGWYAVNSSAAILNAANSIAITTPQTLIDRGEQAMGYLRIAFVGWDKFGTSLTLPSKGVWKGRLLAEYRSPTYGIMRMEIGVGKIVTSL